MAKVNKCVAGAVALALGAFAQQSNADLVYSVGPTTNFNVAAGGTVDIQIFVREFGAGEPKFSTHGGLFSSGFRVTHTGAADDGSITNVTGNLAKFSNVAPSPTTGFDDTSAYVTQTQNDETFTDPPAMPDGLGYLLLGTLTVQAATTNGIISNFSLSDFNPAANSQQFVTYGAFAGNPDSLIGNGAFTVTAVPEPATIGGLGIAATLLLRRRTRTTA